MKLKKYLSNNQLTIEQLDVLLPNYSEILKLYKKLPGNFLYRGSNSDYGFKKMIPRKDRTPRDTSLEKTKLMDEIFFDNFGWYPRTQGLFTSWSSYYVENFGDNIYIVLPSNGYKSITEKNTNKLWNYVHGKSDHDDFDTQKETFKNLIENGYSGKKLFEVTPGEVVIKCDTYYLIKCLGKSSKNQLILQQFIEENI